MCLIYLICLVVVVYGEAVKETQKDEYCTDPRTMRKHAAYTEWADAYSCTRHRCQPGGRNLAIYTVGCKRVEAPESAIECEEVVEDTNMQFPYCCTRLRCLVVVRGEVWTRVLGQPWETLPAAPWSHMYKMKKPPPVDGTFLPKGGPVPGPVYELMEDKTVDRRAAINKDCDKPVARSAPGPGPDIVIALTTNNQKKSSDTETRSKFLSRADEERNQPNDIEAEESPLVTEKVPDIVSEEGMYPADKRTNRDHKLPDNSDDEPGYRGGKESRSHKLPDNSDDEPNYRGGKESRSQKVSLFGPDASSDEYTNVNKRGKKKADPVSEERFFPNPDNQPIRGQKQWKRITQDQWNTSPNIRAQQPDPHDYDKEQHVNPPKADAPFHESEEKSDKPASLQHLVNAIGTRMRDIENVVQQMSEKVQPPSASIESIRADRALAHPEMKQADLAKAKKPNPDNYNRFPPQGGSKYLRAAVDATTEPPLFVGDSMNGYFSDPSNSLLRRSMSKTGPKEPQETYMAPINTERKKSPLSDDEESEIKRKKHTHRRKKSKRGRRKHHREDREKKFSRIAEEKNTVSIEDSNDLGKA